MLTKGGGMSCSSRKVKGREDVDCDLPVKGFKSSHSGLGEVS